MPKIFLSLCFTVLFMAAHPAWAQDWVESEHFRSRLAPAPDGGNAAAVLDVELEEGWHTYGQDPGDAGLPPRFNWEDSQNLKDVVITWPETVKKREADMFDINAYEDAVQFPLGITPENIDDEVPLNLTLKIMVCNEICIPDEVQLSTVLAPAVTEDQP